MVGGFGKWNALGSADCADSADCRGYFAWRARDVIALTHRSGLQMLLVYLYKNTRTLRSD